MQTVFNSTELKSLLTQDLQLTLQLSEVLDKEKSLLRKADAKDIENIAQEKLNILQLVDQNSKLRHQLLEDQQLLVNAIGMQSLIAKSPLMHQDELNSLWTELQTQLQICHEKNLVNGTIIAGSQNNTQAFLNQLKGRDANSDLYGPKGEKTSQQVSGRHTSA